MSTFYGLDVGRRSVKLVKVETGRKPQDPLRSVKAAIRDVKAELDEVQRRAALVQAIKECAQELGASGRTVAVAVPRSESVVKTVNLPPVSVEERAKLIRFQAAKDVPFELSEVVLASGIVGQTPQGSVEVLYAAVRTTVIDQLRQLVLDAGLRPGILEVSTQAAARAVRLLHPEATDALLVQIGALATDVSVIHNGRLAFSRSAGVGDGRGSEASDADGVRWLERLVAEVQRSLRAASEAGEAPKVLLLAGGGALGENVASTLAARLGLKAIVIDPTGEKGSPALLVARGLADPREVSGIPILDLAGRADAQAAFAKRQKYALLATLLIALIATSVFLIRKQILEVEEACNELEGHIRELEPKVAELRKIEKEVLSAQGWKARKGRSLDILLAVCESLPKDEAYLRGFTWTEGQGHTLTINGRVRDSLAAQTFLTRLNKEQIIERATLDFMSSPEKIKDAETRGLDFRITIKLRDLAGHAEEKKS